MQRLPWVNDQNNPPDLDGEVLDLLARCGRTYIC